MSLPEPDFILRDPQAITAAIVAQYEAAAGKTLYPAQIERLWTDVLAYRETLVRIAIQEAAKQNLVAFAHAPMLDYLGELVGVTRLPAAPALTTIQFTAATTSGADRLIPTGTRIAAGELIFATTADVTLPAGQTIITAPAQSETAGVSGNLLQPGQIRDLIDDLGLPAITGVNTTASAGGADEETDDRLRERIRLAPESFTTAGSYGAYRFHAMSAHQSIIDVGIGSLIPGRVDLYPLTTTGLPSSEIRDLVAAVCSAETVRPLCDDVRVSEPIPFSWTLRAIVTPYNTADATAVLAAATIAAQQYAAERAVNLGRDVVDSQIQQRLMVAGAYSVLVEQPAQTIVVPYNGWATCTSVTVTLGSPVDG